MYLYCIYVYVYIYIYIYMYMHMQYTCVSRRSQVDSISIQLSILDVLPLLHSNLRWPSDKRAIPRLGR